jgi:MFS family permease
VTAVPLRRNRDFLLLQAGQLLSDIGSQSAQLAYPLLVLALTGSAARAGVVGFVRALGWTLLALPAGIAADRWDRRRLMLGADGLRVLAVGGLAAAVVADRLAFWAIVVVGFAEGAGTALFLAAQAGALRAVVPARQLPAAAATQTGRQAAVRLAGPPLGGALFGLGRAIPFLVDAASYAFSIVSLLAMRTPFQEARQPDGASLRSRLGEGFRFLWSRPFLRTCAFLFGLANFIAAGVLLALVVLGERQGLSGGQVGALVAVVGGCLLLGSFLSPLVRRLLPVRGGAAAGAVDLVRLRPVPGLAERVRADRQHPAHVAGHPGDQLGGPRLPDRDDARPAARPDPGRLEHGLAADHAARSAGRRGPAGQPAGAGRDRLLRPVRARAGHLGHAQPVDPGGAEPG